MRLHKGGGEADAVRKALTISEYQWQHLGRRLTRQQEENYERQSPYAQNLAQRFQQFGMVGRRYWYWSLGLEKRKAQASAVTTTGPQCPIVRDTKGDVRINANVSPPARK